MTTEEMMEIMKAYIEGNRVQCKALKYDVCIWMDDSNPCWDWNNFEYRVKPEAAEPRYSIDDVTGELKAKTKSLRDDVITIDDVIKTITERCEETAWLPFDSSVVEYLKSVKTLTEENENLKNVVDELKNSCSYQVYGDMLKEKEKYENKIANLNTETEELKAKIKALRAERHEMASAVSNAVWKELMDRAKNIEGPINTSMVGFGFNDISDVVLNKILDYKPEDKPVKKVRRMTGIELAEWCAKGKGLFKNTDKNMIFTDVSFDRDEQLNETVGEWILIRGWDDPDWRDALVEE